MSRVRLGDVAKEHKETCKGDKRDYPIVGLEHLEPECITLSQWSESTDNTFSKVFRKGHVLFGRRRAYLKKAAVAPFDGICSGDITVIEAIPGRIIPELLPFVIQNDALFDFAVGRSAGSLSPRVKWEHLKNYEFELPASEGEQRKLADVLWSIEQTRKSYNSLLRATDELVKSQFIELFGDPGNNPKNWINGTIRDVVSEVRYGSSRPASADGVFPYIRMNNITYDGKLDLSDLKRINIPEQELEKCSVRKGDVLFNRTNSKELVGKTCLYDRDELMVLAGFIIRVRVNSKILPEFLVAYMNLPYTKQLLLSLCKAAIGQANINAQEFQNIPIYQPPLELQERYVSFAQRLDKSKYADSCCKEQAVA
ncbi:MAG: restriction endonuclease subunit S [Akkermansia sp.]|nr:restriction endonuclease subunit S [Akkermansia sp.]